MHNPDQQSVIDTLLDTAWFHGPQYPNLRKSRDRLSYALRTRYPLRWPDPSEVSRLARELATASAPRMQSIIGRLLGRDDPDSGYLGLVVIADACEATQ